MFGKNWQLGISFGNSTDYPDSCGQLFNMIDMIFQDMCDRFSLIIDKSDWNKNCFFPYQDITQLLSHVYYDIQEYKHKSDNNGQSFHSSYPIGYLESETLGWP